MFSIAGIIGFFTGNIKWIAIIALVAAITVGALKYTKLVESYATAQAAISQLEQNVKDKEAALAFEREKYLLTERIIEDLEKDRNELEGQLENITKDLPEDAINLAPESIRETLRRLQENAN